MITASHNPYNYNGIKLYNSDKQKYIAEDISNSYSLISIVNQVALIISSYVGALFLDFISIEILTLISMLLFLFSLFPLYKLKFEHEKNDKKISLIKTIKKIPINNLYIFGA